MRTKTLNDDSSGTIAHGAATGPGVVLVYSGTAPALGVAPVGASPVLLGRGETCAIRLDDEHVSREHTEIRFERERFIVRDCGSRNGTFVNGALLGAEVVLDAPAVIRMGESIFVLTAETRGLAGLDTLQQGDIVAGPALRDALRRVERVALSGRDLLILGETGAGKEIAARAFHASSNSAREPLTSVNCATIPAGIAERLLFGARRGAFSGATADVIGQLAAAAGGVLFLDEIGELDLAVQAKLLRFLETREVTPLGATNRQVIEVQLCFATHSDLRRGVREGRVRADFYYRISEPSVSLPSLRERREEIPWLVARELERTNAGLVAHPKFVEACILSSWPGNVRELLGAVRRAADEARHRGSHILHAKDLERPIEEVGARAAEIQEVTPAEKPTTGKPGTPELTREIVERALAECEGNVAATARALGVHRRHLYRALARLGIRGGE